MLLHKQEHIASINSNKNIIGFAGQCIKGNYCLDQNYAKVFHNIKKAFSVRQTSAHFPCAVEMFLIFVMPRPIQQIINGSKFLTFELII